MLAKARLVCRPFLAALALATIWVAGAMPALAADPIRIGLSVALTGAVAPNGKVLLATLEIWRDDLNAKGGLLGRPVELVYYDDQSIPSNVPGIYTKLITIDRVDLLLGPYATNMIAAAMPVIMSNNKTTIGMLGTSINRQFHYPRYFSMVPTGSEGAAAFSRGWFEIAAAQKPKPKTVAIVAADAEFGKTACDGTRQNAKAGGFDIVYDRSYPPPTTDFAPILRAVQATNPDLVFVCAYPPDTVGFVRAADEINLNVKMFGGAMIGLFVAPIKIQLGPLMNGIVFMESFVPTPKMMSFPGLGDALKRYQARAPELKTDPLGYSNVPFGYAAGQVLAQAVEGTKGLDHDKLAQYVHSHTFPTVLGDIAFGEDGEWAKSRQFITQFQGISGNGLDQFRDATHQVVLWPDEYKTGTVVYPYEAAKK